ncbi:ATP-binding protein [Streptomyces varsoviensis]|uniref:ATP-binding protein n=1 Tax=Streptomyces varsoviensis TaxID=67373 RepID=UPI00340EDD09
MTDHIPAAVVWCLAAALVVTLVLLVRQRQITAGVRKRAAALESSLRARDEELHHLATVRLRAVEDSANQPVPPPGLLDQRLTGTPYAHSLQTVLDLFRQAGDKAKARAEQSAKAALKASMRALQGLAHEQQLSISDMQDRHDNPDVLRDLLEIDHANSQFGRRAQAIAVLCGSWPGRQRAASALTDVVRGAKSRIRDYRRVQVHSQADIAVVSRAVEPVVLAVAELLDNAARHSQPNTTVEVGLQPVHNGACVVIDDAGVGMDGQEVQQATALLSGERVPDVSRLGDPPQFGFAVIGVLAARYGFSVSVDTRSPYGGVRAVLFLPSALLTHLDADAPAAAAPPPERPRPSRRVPAPAPGADPLGAPAAPQGPYDSPATLQDSYESPAAPQGPYESPARLQGPYETQAPPPGPYASHADRPGAVHGATAGGLPKRRRRQAAPQRQDGPAAGYGQSGQPGRHSPYSEPGQYDQHGQAPVAEPPRERTAEETARRMGAFARGTRSGRSAADATEDEGNPHA